MTDSVLPGELLARYVVSSRWYRRKDQTVKPEAFIPPEAPLELSVTRHLGLSEKEIWSIGDEIASGQKRTLHGRADVRVSNVTARSLNVAAAPTPGNPNHANIAGWPPEKDARKILALKIAKDARFVVNSNNY